MKLKIISLSLFLSFITIPVLFLGCSEDTVTTNNPPPPSGGKPSIRYIINSSYDFSNDSLSANGVVTPTDVKTTHTVLAQGLFFGRTAYQIQSTSLDTAPPSTFFSVDTFYISYDSTAGKLYQYNIAGVFDTTQTGVFWDEIADFTLPLKTIKTIRTISNISGITGLNAELKTQVASDTVITSANKPPFQPVQIKCYRIELTATLIFFGLPMGTIYFDYFIAYLHSQNPANLSGIVRSRLRAITLPPPVNLNMPGLDQTIRSWRFP